MKNETNEISLPLHIIFGATLFVDFHIAKRQNAEFQKCQHQYVDIGN
jgi:hypothetical protein